MKQIILISIISLTHITCSDVDNNSIERIVDEYYEIYNKRQSIDKFLGFYDNEIEFEDIIIGDKIKGKTDLRKFLNWENPDFIMLESNILKITEKIIDGNKAVIKGYFTKFQWGQIEFGPMHFTTILVFNGSGKIIKQVDWINYSSVLVNYNERKNSNKWIKYSPPKVFKKR